MDSLAVAMVISGSLTSIPAPSSSGYQSLIPRALKKSPCCYDNAATSLAADEQTTVQDPDILDNKETKAEQFLQKKPKTERFQILL